MKYKKFKNIKICIKKPIPYIALRGRKPFQACFFILCMSIEDQSNFCQIEMCNFRLSLLKEFCFKIEKNNFFNCGSKIQLSESGMDPSHKLSSPSTLMYANATQQFNSLLSPTTIQTGQNELESCLKEHKYFHIILTWQ